MTSRDRCAQKGFTLIEIILVIVILSIAAVPLFGQFSRSGLSTLTSEEIQTAAQLAQERAEHLFAVRRNRGYSDPELSVASFIEDLNATSYARYTRTTTITDPFAGNGCPVGAPCKQVVVQVTDDASGSIRSEITFVLVSY